MSKSQVAAAVLALIGVTFFAVVQKILRKPFRHRSAVVLVLGDVGRSPRMMYHAQSLAHHDYTTALVGYDDTLLIPSLLASPLVQLLPVSNPPRPLLLLPWIARAPIRVVWQVWSVLEIILWRMPVHAEVLLVQNPPSIPTLALAQIICFITGSKLIIDWHNTGYSILAMRTGEASLLCRAARWFEAKFGQHAYAHLFVTRALHDYLVKEWDLKGITAVLHDRPPPHFKRTPAMIQHELFRRLVPSMDPSLPIDFAEVDTTRTPFTIIQSGQPVLDPRRPALVVSSTSWTADEDFTPFLTALDECHQAYKQGTLLPRIFVIVTGKGALRAAFEEEIAKREKIWKGLCVRCIFVAAADYPSLLGCADLGISMHSSSSGRDLPMKVVDMFGCGVPVLARDFPAIGELVLHDLNGKVWTTGAELGKQMVELLSGFPQNTGLSRLHRYFHAKRSDSPGPGNHGRIRRGSLDDAGFEWTSWDVNWDSVVYRGLLSRPLEK